ncbi:MAG: DUF4276 family protein [Chroococcales cyanobacterium]
MVKEIRFYIEGGGDTSNSRSDLRRGFKTFLDDLVQIARERRIKWNLSVCGSRNEAYRDFENALADHPDAYNILLVDSEGPVTEEPWQHLKSRDNWDSLGTEDDQCHLMVQAMEAWFMADLEALSRFYGQRFQASSLPRNPNIEEIPKDSLEPSLKAATRQTQKGEYRKIQHGSLLLQKIDVQKVRGASKQCDRLFQKIEEILKS